MVLPHVETIRDCIVFCLGIIIRILYVQSYDESYGSASNNDSVLFRSLEQHN